MCPECGGVDLEPTDTEGQSYECQECGWVGGYDELEEEK